MLRIFSLEDVDRRHWRRVLERSEHATVFHTLEWLELQKRFFRLKEVLVCSDDCVFPVFVKRKGVFTIYGSPVPETGAIYGGPVCTGSGVREVLEYFGRVSPFSALFIKTPCGFDESVFEGWEVERVGNYVVELDRDSEVMWGRMNKKARNAVRKAERSGVRVEMCGGEGVEEYYKLVLQVAERKRLLPLPQEFMRQVVDSGLGRLMLAFMDGRAVAGGIFLCFRDTVTYWDGASDTAFRSYQPSSLVQWELMKWAAEQGFRWYDMGGAGIGSIARFKRRWGGRYVEFLRVYREGVVARAVRRAYARLRCYPWVSRIFRS
ncbi:MAG: GNAT family N-acetyltransferase [Euryarchaeota archaeon]|nr:GNAT family N-acetyltransferase [Euryarchaeota archaeon]